MRITASAVRHIASKYNGVFCTGQSSVSERKFKSAFGLTRHQVARLWNLLDEHGSLTDHRHIEYLLGALMFLKTYATTDVLSTILKRDEKTLRHWIWFFVERIAQLDLIRWENRLLHDNGSRCKISVDGTDFHIQEPIPFDSRWFTKKFNGPGVRYEVGICIQTGWIVWINGPFPCGEYPDLKIAMSSLVHMFEGDERAVADSGYQGAPEYFDTPWKHLDNQHQKDRKGLARARHECVNRRFKKWQCLLQRWRHVLEKHGVAFHAVANIEQMLIERRPMWQLQYYDRIHNEFDI